MPIRFQETGFIKNITLIVHSGAEALAKLLPKAKAEVESGPVVARAFSRHPGNRKQRRAGRK